MPAKVDVEKCSGCGSCADVCPCEAITVDDVASVDPNECTDCGSCVDECPEEAITLDD
ncbi:MAG: 4Fe-4S binding protein [Firmicutes bacterium]|nr:4Fe-4S binding protein [Bacillota bacterium]